MYEYGAPVFRGAHLTSLKRGHAFRCDLVIDAIPSAIPFAVRADQLMLVCGGELERACFLIGFRGDSTRHHNCRQSSP